MSRGEANGVEVEWLRDTGSSVSIVRSSLVTPDQYTGKVVTCILVDQCVKKMSTGRNHGKNGVL